MNLTVKDIEPAQLTRALDRAGLRLMPRDGDICLEHKEPLCDICGNYSSKMIEGACIECNERHNIELTK